MRVVERDSHLRIDDIGASSKNRICRIYELCAMESCICRVNDKSESSKNRVGLVNFAPFLAVFVGLTTFSHRRRIVSN